MNLQDKIAKINIAPGKPIPFGATVNRTGVNFCVQLKKMGKLELLVYKRNTLDVVAKYDFSENMRFGKVYAMQVNGYDIKRFDYGYMLDGIAYKDNYAKIINKKAEFGKEEEFFTYSVYCDDYDWEDDKKQEYDYSDMIIYRLHTRAFTMHKSSKVKNKGTYKGIAEKIPYFKELGITSVELMPAYDFDEFVNRKWDKNADLRNSADSYSRNAMTYYNSYSSYSNYNNYGNYNNYNNYNKDRNSANDKINFFGYGEAYYFSPKNAFSSKKGVEAVREFKDMVKALHKAEIEVIMEFNFTKDVNLQMISDCLRHWVMEYHIDGVRINLDVANVDMLKSDPILWNTKIIGDRWDIISGCEKHNPVFGEKRHVGVCHDGFMITARRFIKSDEDQIYDITTRMSENNEIGGIINYLANHNSFTLMDTVSYERKHNEANGENNGDGSEYNYSWNCGVEGATKKRKVMELRKKQMKNALALLLLSQGTPMIFAGDEMCHTRNGNNNPYCQDNDINYINWSRTKCGNEIFEYVKKLISYRKSHPILHMTEKMKMADYKSLGYPDLSLHGILPWRIDYHHINRTFAMLYNEKYAGGDNLLFIACNMYWEEQEVNMPLADGVSKWKVDIVTEDLSKEIVRNNRTLVVPPRSVVVLSLEKTIPNTKDESVHKKQLNKLV